MGAPTETWKGYKIECSRCSAERNVELHHSYEPYEDEDKQLGASYGLRVVRQGWEFRIVERVTSGNFTELYVDFICPKCVAEENKGKEVVNA